MTDTWGRRIFKIGASFLILLAAVHSISLFAKRVPANDTEKRLLELMNDYQFNLMGSTRTMWMLLRGFSISFALGALGFGILDFMLSGERAATLKKIALANVIWLTLNTAVSLRYFFILPTTFLAVALLIFLTAWLKLPNEKSG